MKDLLNIVYCKDIDKCFLEVVHKLSYDRYDYDKDDGYTNNNGAGTKKVYGPKATNDRCIRKPNLEGGSEYEDWVFIPLVIQAAK